MNIPTQPTRNIIKLPTVKRSVFSLASPHKYISSTKYIYEETPMKKQSALLLVTLLCFSLVEWGCSSSNTVKGGAIGAAAGGVLGGIVGNKAGNTAAGVIIGAAV